MNKQLIDRIAKRIFLQCLRYLLAGLLCANVAYANQLVINGIDGDLAENVKIVAGDFPDNEALIDLYIELLPAQTREALAAYGYFEPDIDIKRTVVDEEIIVSVTVDPGLPVKLTSINVEVTGPGQSDVEFDKIRDRFPLKEGAVFLSGDYEETKNLLIGVAQTNGYFDFKFITNTVLVSRLNRTAVVNLVAQSGPRFTFGTIKFDQSVFSDTFLNRWVPFQPNDPYSAPLIAEFTQNLQNSGYFSSVRVSPQRDVRYGATVPILVSLQRKENNQVGLGIGYSSDEKLRGKATWGKPLINRAGHSADTELRFSRNSQAMTFSYRIPRENQPLYNYWGFEYGVQNTDKPGDKSLLSTLNFQRVRRFGSEWQESVFIRWERERFTVARVQSDTDLVLPGVRYSRSRTQGYPFLSWGQSSSFQFLYGNRKLLSSIDFYKANLDFKYLRSISPRNTIILAFQYGAITTNDFDRVPVSQRFYAGGDRSIRGFKFRTVSPLDVDGNPRGGRYLETYSVEHNYRFADRWSFAIFTDVGRAFNNFSTSHRIGAGIGIRWQSPVGPFRLDIARPIGEGSNKDIQFHLSLGPDI